MNRIAPLLLCLVMMFGRLDAGSAQQSYQAIDRYGAEYVEKLSAEVNRQMDERKVNVAFIARCGRPRAEMPEGIDFTHVGIAVFEPVLRDDGQLGYTYCVYNLYQGVDGDKDRSQLVQDFTFDMCSGAVEPEIGIIVPSDELQLRILEVLRSPAYVKFHNPKYNLLANPFNDQYDNCVTHTLKVLVASIYKSDDPERVFSNIRQYFKPSIIKLSMVERIGVNFMSGVSNKDVEDGKYQTATYASLRDFLSEYKLLKECFVVRVEPDNKAEAPKKTTK